MKIRIGYQGIEGSNSEWAAKKFAEHNCFGEVEYVPLISSSAVVNAMLLDSIDYGVMAYRNNIGGLVSETVNALSSIHYEMVMRAEMKIHHSLFVRDSSVDVSDITAIISHEQALKQCDDYLDARFPDAEIIKSDDTAIAAADLADGRYDRATTAVICKKEAGLSRGLFLLDENIEDAESITEFFMIRKSPNEAHNGSDKPKTEIARIKRLKLIASPALSVALIGISLLLTAIGFILGGTLAFTFITSGAVFAFIAAALTAFRGKIMASVPHPAEGYWRYNAAAVSGQDPNQAHDFTRIVEIKRRGGMLHFDGWLCSKFIYPLFSSTKSSITPPDVLNGSIVYWYTGTVNISTNAAITGVAVVEWNVENEYKQINKMNGWYLGSASKEIGTLSYTRITKAEFDYVKNNRPIQI